MTSRTGCFGLLLLAVPLVAVAEIRAAEPVPEKSVGQLEKERETHFQRFQKLLQEKKLPEAIAAAEEVTQLARQLLARAENNVPDNRDVLAARRGQLAGALGWLADRYEEREDWPAAIEARKEIVPLKTDILGPGHWQVIDARLALAHVERFSTMTAEQRRELAEAVRADMQVRQLYRQRKHAEAIPLAMKAAEIRKEHLGEKHSDYATSLNNLAMMYRALGDYARAEPLYRQALEIRKEVLGDKHPIYATSLNSLALIYKAKGDYVRAEPLYRQNSEIKKATTGKRR